MLGGRFTIPVQQGIWVLAFTSVGKYDGTIKGVCPQGKVVGSHNVEYGRLWEPTPNEV